MQFLRIVCEPRCLEIHNEVLQELTAMLVDYRCKSYQLYREVVEELGDAFVAAASVRWEMGQDMGGGGLEQVGILRSPLGYKSTIMLLWCSVE